ncbi:hypothetical protein SAMN02745664_1324 [Moraxella cuniculi DSM 21768]|uniref:Helix-turn-helix domain-containing protein n=1 Tax=Moraxella cuniculi DSM 21768 TaxID=1122245 RepID=A0A1N7GBL3_9GAMM|nr:hypothetical protein [Moraxella cuniculi]OOS02154.1 hypothetical protein B0189_10930 [Moraxella cuniculi]SIS09969.1 hypothetical protein SAMN02745664_1324 [Moraxella cuniculi DSM 21768]
MKKAPLTHKHKKALSATTKRMYEHLLQGNSLTALDGVQLFGCLCTTQRLGELRRIYNIPICGEYFFTSNGKRLKRYYLDADYIKQHKNSPNRPWDTNQTTNPTNI